VIQRARNRLVAEILRQTQPDRKALMRASRARVKPMVVDGNYLDPGDERFWRPTGPREQAKSESRPAEPEVVEVNVNGEDAQEPLTFEPDAVRSSRSSRTGRVPTERGQGRAISNGRPPPSAPQWTKVPVERLDASGQAVDDEGDDVLRESMKKK
jgi:hypothetical protein